MSSQASSKSISRLTQMQMRFQQKQQVERDQKRTELSGSGKKSLIDSTDSKILTSTLGAGKGSQYITNKSSDIGRRGIDKNSDSSSYEDETMIDNTNYSNANIKAVRKQLSGMTLNNNSNNIKLKPIADVKVVNKPLNPKPKLSQIKTTATKPTVPRLGTVPRSNIEGSSTNSSRTPSSANSTKSPIKSPTNSSTMTARRIGSSFTSDAISSASSNPPDANSCRICGRHFNEDRLAKHEAICESTKTKKRKIFDATKHRVKGTDAEQFVKKNGRVGKKAEPVIPRKGDWRRKHVEFIQAIRSAKEMQAHLARGGKVSDLPPPPPSENPDYVQCPHCNRRFNQGAAERHIPKCATFKHNKPKPNAPKPSLKAKY